MNKRILIIDDDAPIRDSLKKVLELRGYAVLTAEDGQEGLDRLRGHVFDLVILDLELPVLCGLDVLDAVRTELPSLPLIVLSGELHQCEPGALLGSDAVLEKPCDVEILFQTMEQLLTEPAEKRLRRVCAGLSGTPPVSTTAVDSLARLFRFSGGKPA